MTITVHSRGVYALRLLALASTLLITFSAYQLHAQTTDDTLRSMLEGSQLDDELLERTQKVDEAGGTVRLVFYVIAGIVLACIGAAAFFGRMRWTWFFAVLGGVLLISLSDYLIGYLFIEDPTP